MKNKKETAFLSAFLAENWQAQNFGRELLFSVDLCYNGGSVKASLVQREVAAEG